MPEATILSRQMQAELVGKTVAGFELRDCQKLQRIGFVNENPEAFERLVGRDVESVISRGNTILVRLSGRQNLIISPEYGGEILYQETLGSLRARYHLRLDMPDGSTLTVRVTSMGAIYATDDAVLSEHYMIRRDFDLDRPQPNDEQLTLESGRRRCIRVSRMSARGTVTLGLHTVVSAPSIEPEGTETRATAVRPAGGSSMSLSDSPRPRARRLGQRGRKESRR